MRLYVFFSILLMNVVLAKGQNTFNLRERYHFLACVLTSVEATDSCYYATGIIADTIFPYNTGAIFLKLGLDGKPLLIKTLKSTEKTYEPWFKGLLSLDDGSFIIHGITSDSTSKALLIKYNSEGDTVFTKEYYHPFHPQSSFIQPRGGLVALPDGGFYITNWIEKISTVDTDIYLIRTDSLGNKLWSKTYATAMNDRPSASGLTQQGKLVIGSLRDNLNTNTEDYILQDHIFQVDSVGNVEWAYTTPLSDGQRDLVNDMLLLDDGSIIVASGVVHELMQSSVNGLDFERYVFKLNPQHQLEWELTFPDSALTGWARTTNLVELSDGSGYVLAGMTYNTQPPPKYFTIRGWLSKISSDGDSIWTRRYAFLVNGENEHKIYDIKETLDGGLIICGEAYSWNNNITFPQQAWLLKLDQYGCLIPGCQLNDAADEEGQPKIQLVLYPNPTADYLNFYLRGPNMAKDQTFRIVNGEGKVMRQYEGSTFNMTFIVPVWDWASGAYWLQVMEHGRAIVSEQFIISK